MNINLNKSDSGRSVKYDSDWTDCIFLTGLKVLCYYVIMLTEALCFPGENQRPLEAAEAWDDLGSENEAV